MNIRQKFGKWEVSETGDMIWDGARYAIYDYQLTKNDWFIHLSGKRWIDWNEFIPAYIQALKHAGIREVSFISEYDNKEKS